MPLFPLAWTLETIPRRGVSEPQLGNRSAEVDRVKLRAVALQPVLRLVGARAQATAKSPEVRTVIHLVEMGNLMGGEIVDHEGRRQEKLKLPSQEHEPQRERVSFMVMDPAGLRTPRA